MHVVIRKYATSPEYIDQTRPKLAHLEETMRGLPGFVAYHFVETEDGITTITITEDETGTAESMGRAITWMRENTPEDLPGAPEVIEGHTLISATR
jgi:quinol monooxygenase YgiN